jgi:2-polyprenyl-6-methoxyphenol hydroxylase-like FAD-dependent oxidoreductase
MALDPLARLEPNNTLPPATRKETLDRVLIAGAGPTGLCAAMTLARAGVPVTVLEKGPALATESRASTLHPPTLELLAEMGIIDAILAQGLRAPTTQFRDRRTGPVATFDLGVLSDETAYPFRVQLEQNKIAAILYDALLTGSARNELDVEIRLNHRAHAATRNDPAVGATVLVGTVDGFVSIEAPWVLGCDGAHSPVRESLGITLGGDVYPEQFLVVSVADELTELLPDLSFVNYVADPQEWLVLLRTPDHWRVLFPISPDDVAEAELPHVVQQRLNAVVGENRNWDVLSTSLYVVRRAVAARMFLGRVLLAGDSAHQNSPLGGMGMNSGIQDGVSVGRRLGAVWNGTDGVATLDEYNRIRREVAVGFVQADSHANWQVLREPNPEVREEMQRDLRACAADPLRHRDRMRRAAMLDAVRNNL